MVRGKCYFCGNELEFGDKVFRKDTCPKCQRDLHACVQCRFYDPKAYNQCLETMAERVVEKEKANLCSYFEFRGRREAGREAGDAKRKLEELFKKK